MPDNAPLTLRYTSIQDGTGGQTVTEVVVYDGDRGRVLLRSPGWPTQEDDLRVDRMVHADRLHDGMVAAVRTALAALDDPRKETAARHVLEDTLALVTQTMRGG